MLPFFLTNSLAVRFLNTLIKQGKKIKVEKLFIDFYFYLNVVIFRNFWFKEYVDSRFKNFEARLDEEKSKSLAHKKKYETLLRADMSIILANKTKWREWQGTLPFFKAVRDEEELRTFRELSSTYWPALAVFREKKRLLLKEKGSARYINSKKKGGSLEKMKFFKRRAAISEASELEKQEFSLSEALVRSRVQRFFFVVQGFLANGRAHLRRTLRGKKKFRARMHTYMQNKKNSIKKLIKYVFMRLNRGYRTVSVFGYYSAFKQMNIFFLFTTSYLLYQILFSLLPVLGVRMTAVSAKSNLKRKGRKRKPYGIPISLFQVSKITRAVNFFKRGLLVPLKVKKTTSELSFKEIFIFEMLNFLFSTNASALTVKRNLYKSVVQFRPNFHFRWWKTAALS